MISVEVVGKKYVRCQSCYANEKILDISIGLNENQTTTIRLCPECVLDLYERATIFKRNKSEKLI